MSGGKGGSSGQTQTTMQMIPPYLEEPIKQNIARAQEISNIGYRPYYGPDVAALTPMQEAAMRSTGEAAEAYGIPNTLGNQVAPEPEVFAGGVRGYSSGSLFDQAVEELQERRPGQYDAIMGQFIDPFTGLPYGGGGEQAAAPDMQETYKELGYVETPVNQFTPAAHLQRAGYSNDEIQRMIGTAPPQTYTNQYGQEVTYVSPYQAEQDRLRRIDMMRP